MAANLKLVLAGILCCLLLKGFYNLIFNLYPNNCEMTYMYEVPEYIKIDIDQSTPAPTNSVAYKLYAYGEGLQAEALKNGKFNGIPVLFIPGNGGSYKQVRSSASVALRKSLEYGSKKVHFDFFTADFNEEFSALSGPLLDTQTQFVKRCIGRILSLYKKGAAKKTSVILMGHSLGGMVAMGSAVDESLHKKISLIINLATPLARPVISIDSELDAYYHKVNSYWTKEKNFALKHIPVISISAGRNDFQVPSFLTTSSVVDVDASAQSVPGCWLTMDHIAIVWCRQLVLATVRALFDSIDSQGFSLKNNKNAIISAFKFHLIQRSRCKSGFASSFLSNVTALLRAGSWTEAQKRQEHFAIARSSQNSFVTIPIYKDEHYYKHLAIVGREIDWHDWVFACKLMTGTDGSKKCVAGENLSYKGVRIPGGRKEVNIGLKSVFKKGFDHIVIWVQPNDDKASLNIDVSNGASRSKKLNAPAFAMSMFAPTLVTEATPFQALTFNVTLTGITESWQSYVLTVTELHQCVRTKRVPILRIRPSWQSRWDVLLSGPTGSDFTIEVDPTHVERNENSSVRVHMILQPSCTYNISLQVNPSGVFKRVSLIYGPQIPAFIASHLLLALANQMKVIGETRKCPSIFTSLLTLSPMSVVPFVTLLNLGLEKLSIDTDLQLMKRIGIDVGYFHIFLFLSSYPLTILGAGLIWAAVMVWGKAAYYCVERFLKRSLGVGEIAGEAIIWGLFRYPFIYAITLIAVAASSSSSMAFILAFIYYFVKMFKLYEDYLEKTIHRLVGLPGENVVSMDLSSMHLNFTLMLLVLLLAGVTSPGLINWAIQWKKHSIYDPNLLATAFILIALGLVWQIKLCRPSKNYARLAMFMQLLAVVTVLMGSVTMHRVIVTMALAIVTVSLEQLVAGVRGADWPPIAVSVAECDTCAVITEPAASGSEELLSFVGNADGSVPSPAHTDGESVGSEDEESPDDDVSDLSSDGLGGAASRDSDLAVRT